MKRRLLASLLTLVMMLSLLPTAVLALDEAPTQGTPTEVSQEAQNGDQQQQKTEAEPQEQSKEISSEGGELTTGSYVLNKDVELRADLTVPEGAVVTLDLNGHTLKGTGNGSVIVVNSKGELTVKDSSNNSGKITGGNALKENTSINSNTYNGGAIYVGEEAKLTMTGGTITENKAFNGGGIYMGKAAVVVITGGEISNNKSLRDGGGGGGAIYAYGEGGSLNIEGCKLKNNTAVYQGGAIFTDGPTYVGVNTEISGNTAAHGGGICANDYLKITGGVISNNTATGETGTTAGKPIYGGGVLVNGATLDLEGGVISNNKVVMSTTLPTKGGGIYCDVKGTINIQGSPVVKENTANDQAQNIYLESNRVLNLSGNVGTDAELNVTLSSEIGRVTNVTNYSLANGVIKPDDQNLVVTVRDSDVYLTKNVDENEAICSIQVENKTVYFDTLDAAMASLPSDDNKVTLLKNCELTSTIVVPETEVVLTSNGPITIEWPNATNYLFYIPANAKLTVEGNITIQGNYAEQSANSKNEYLRAFEVLGILNIGKKDGNTVDSPVVKDFNTICVGSDNKLKATYSYGAIEVSNGGTLNFYSGTLKNNAANIGGAIYATGQNSVVNLYGGEITENKAYRGGGVAAKGGATVNLAGTTISKNTATSIIGDTTTHRVDNAGGGLYIAGANLNITAGEIKENVADNSYGGGLFAEGQSTYAKMSGGKIVGNVATATTGESSVYIGRGGGVNIASGAEFTLSDGEISNNEIRDTVENSKNIATAGAGVIVEGTFNMTGGTVSGNKNAHYGAGLYITVKGTANLTGGTITGNEAKTAGGGVYLANSVAHGERLTVANTPVISDNTVNGAANNLFIVSGKTVELTGEMSNGAAIGVTTQANPANDNPIQITTAETGTDYYKDAASYFIPDAAKVIAQANESGNYVELAYTADTYHKVTLDLSHASVSIGSPTTMVKGGESCTIGIKADEGYTLPVEAPSGVASYNCDNSKTTANVTVTPTANTNITIEAVANRYKVVFNGNDSTSGSMAAQAMTYDATNNLTANAYTKTGCNFAGWSTTKNGSCEYPDKASVKNLTAENGGTVTLYAIWTEKTPIHKFDDGDTAIQSHKYDGKAKQYVLTSAVNDFVIAYQKNGANIKNPTNVGTYDVIISRAEDATYAAFSQTITGGLVITAADYPVTVSADRTAVTGGGTVKLTASSSVEGITVTGITCSDPSITVTSNGGGSYSVILPGVTKTYTFTAEVTGDLSNYGNGPATCTVSVTRRHTSSVTPGNTVSVPSTPSGTVTVNPSTASKGETVTITTKPSEGYELGSIEVLDKNGDSLKLKDLGNGKYSFVMPDGKVSVEAEFVKTAATSFADVPANAYFADAVKWAVDKGITNGLSDTTFGPYESCTRAQIVTFLWRAAGSPEPKTMSSFTDVPASAYYAKAVAWAVENGITNGMTETTFAPDATCTRGQSVTFLHRALKGTASGSTNFTDVASDAFYADAINWAVASNVTNGTSATTFSPNADCTRAEIVTFLYRAYQGK